MKTPILHRLTVLSSIALLTLASCTDQSNAKSSVQSAGLSQASLSNTESASSTPIEAPANQAQQPDVVEAPSLADTVAMNLLSDDQKAQLAQLGVEVVLPTYLPSGFQLALFQAHRKASSNPTDYTYYTVSYKGPNNTCVEAGNGYQNTALLTNQERSLSAPVGTFKIQSGTYSRTPITRHWAALPGNQIILTGGAFPYGQGNCNPIAEGEFDKVLQSARVVE